MTTNRWFKLWQGPLSFPNVVTEAIKNILGDRGDGLGVLEGYEMALGKALFSIKISLCRYNALKSWQDVPASARSLKEISVVRLRYR